MEIIVTWSDGREEMVNGEEITHDDRMLLGFGHRARGQRTAPIIKQIPLESIRMARREGGAGGGRIVTGLARSSN